MSRLRDDLAVFNERIKLIATSMNAVALGLIGFAVLRPVTDAQMALGWPAMWWAIVGVAFHLSAHYVLGMLEKEADNDGL